MAWRTPVTSATLTTDANYESFLDSSGNPIILRPNPREVVHFVFTIASEVGEVDSLDWQLLAGHRIIQDSIVGDTTDGSNFDLASGDSQVNDYYMGMYILFTTGDAANEFRLIGDYVNSTDAVVLVTALSSTPSAGSLYDIYHLSEVESGSVISETTLTEALPQNDQIATSGYSTLIPRAKASGATDAHIALCTYSIDGVDA